MRRRSARVAIISAGLAMVHLVAFTVCIAWARAANAGDRPCIVAFISQANAGAAPRLRAELAVAGFDLRVAADSPWPPTRERMEEVARLETAVAALALIPREGRSTTEVWVVDRVTAKTVVRVFSPPPVGYGDEAELLAISAVETLRATLMEINLGRQAQGEMAAPPAVKALVAIEDGRFAGRVASVVGLSRGGLGAVWQVGLGATMNLSPRLRLGLEGNIPLTAASVRGPEGTAEIRLWLGGPFVEASLAKPGGRPDVRLAGGVWAARLSMRGIALAPYTGATIGVTTVAPHIDVILGWRFSRWLSVATRLSAAAAAPGVTVQFEGRDAATWGRPFGLGALLFEARFD